MMPFDFRHLLQAAGGQVVGKVRLQKSVYLLDQLGLNSGFSYDYHHYGPYSEELADQVDTDVVFGLVEECVKRRAGDGVPYSIFISVDDADSDKSSDWSGDLSAEDISSKLREFDKYSATVLELAATIHWLAYREKVADWRSELVVRKGVKATQDRIDQALKLLKDLGLASKTKGS